MALFKNPTHLGASSLDSCIVADIGIGLSVFARLENWRIAGSIMATTLSVLDRGTTIAFEAFGSRTTNNSRPAIDESVM